MPKNIDKNTLKQKEIELVIARLEIISPKVYFSSGGGGTSISRDDMIKHVKSGDKIGKEFVKTDLEFLRALKNGKLLNQILIPRLS